MPTKKTVTTWQISKLKDHPRQAEIFGDVDEGELKALAENMRKRGQRDPVEVTPDGTVIAGHQRVRAAKLLGWREIDVVVRHDLAAEGPTAVEEHFIEDNFVRRHLTPLALAKCLKRLMELEEGRNLSVFGFRKKEELKARIAARMRLSPRSVSRYLLILGAPVAVQRAFDAGAITLVAAGQVARMSKKEQAEVARRIAAGEKPRTVLADVRRNGPALPVAKPGTAFGRIVAALRQDIRHVRGQRNRISANLRKRAEECIREAIEVLSEFAPARARVNR